MGLKKSLLIAGIVFSAAIVSSQGVEAQDNLPRDNGIFTYHQPPRWRESESHPLRIGAYILHPIGWVLREGIFRPFSSFAASTPFTRSFFGYRDISEYRDEMYCFKDASTVPDCRSVAPFNAIDRTNSVEQVSEKEAALNAPAESQVYFPDIAFEFNKANLNDLGRARVRQVAQLLSSVPNLKVVVEGHTDYKGSDEYNMALGKRRADTVIKELGELGVDTARLTPISYGEGKPLFTEEEDWARAANRRVHFGSGEGAAVVAPAAAAKTSELPAAKKN